MKITLDIEDEIAQKFTGVCDETCQDVAACKLYKHIRDVVLGNDAYKDAEQARQAKLEQGIPSLDAKIVDLEK